MHLPYVVLLASTAWALNGGEARAACNVTSTPNSVTCAANTTTTLTTNTDAGNPSSSDYRQVFTTGGAVAATVNAGVTVDGNGLTVDTTAQAGAASAITFTNNGSISTAGVSLNTVDLEGNGGLIRYSGNGSIAGEFGTGGLTVRNRNSGAILINTGTGSIPFLTATTDGAGAVLVNSTGPAGAINTTTVNGSTSITTSHGSGTITAVASGAGDIILDANGATSSVNLQSNGGNVTVNTNGGVSVSGLGTAIIAETTGTGNTVVNVNSGGVRSGTMVGAGIVAYHGAGTGNVSVYVAPDAAVSGTAGEVSTALYMFNAGSGSANAMVLGTLFSPKLGGLKSHLAADFNGTLNVGNGGTTGMLIGDVKLEDSNTVLKFNRSDAVAYAQAIRGAGSVEQDGTGTMTLSGASDYTGATRVNAGTLLVNGVVTATSGVSVASGATLGGTGTIGGPVSIASGGTLAPGDGTAGSSLSIAGSLAFQSGAFYLVQVNPITASFTNATGTATLNGATVQAVFAPGSYVERQYRILTATAGVSGTFASTVVDTNLPSNFKTDLSYDAANVYLNLSLSSGSGLNANQQAVSNAFVNYFNANGGIPLIYAALTPAGLTKASGELGTGSQQTTFNAMGQFMGLLTDPFVDRGGAVNPNAGAPAFAEDEALSYAATNKRDAYAMFAKAAPRAIAEPRWRVWAAGFGGSQTTNGDVAVGSNNTTSSIYGTAVGADYLLSPQTLAGFALAGGGTSFGVNGFGSGRSDLFQAGAYLRHVNGPSYISAALAYGWQDITTNRTVTIAGVDQLRAEFNANAWSGRLEGGYRFVAPWTGGIGLTPYAAGQFTTFDLPAYAESVVSGGGAFALAYGAKSVTDTRSELGLRSDKSFANGDGVITLRGRLAWAHDFNPDRAVAATFQALPGASFVVNGATQASEAALVTAAAEKRWLNGWSAVATFEGEFSEVTRSYAGKGVVRYQW